ncbi:hypothetical protein MYX82_10740 [Acidobacteria bacterium AH-259-D05]|nr:hypothetical protein [Acidobacteria bacterium AH-259-D05]
MFGFSSVAISLEISWGTFHYQSALYFDLERVILELGYLGDLKDALDLKDCELVNGNSGYRIKWGSGL